MPDVKVEVLGESDLPDEVRDALRDKLGELLGGHRHTFSPASKDQALLLIEGSGEKFAVGDVITLRDFAGDRFKWPKLGDEVIVTQVLDQPYRSGDGGTGEPAGRNDIAIAFTCNKGHIHEFLHDSRLFRKVGTIFQ